MSDTTNTTATCRACGKPTDAAFAECNRCGADRSLAPSEPATSPPAATAPKGWGLAPAPGTRYHWSARAIYRDGTVDLLHDRQGIEGTASPEERKALCHWLDVVGLPLLRKLCAGRDAPSPRERHEVTVGNVNAPGYTLRANPNASAGYLYLSCAPDGTMYSPSPRAAKRNRARRTT
jgi:hypothetical protein